jgi:MarR family transcriptional repressor of emrRAB
MEPFDANLVAAFAMTISDKVDRGASDAAGASGAGPAALAMLTATPGLGVDALAAATGLSGSGGVRLVDRLERARLVERRPGDTRRSISLWLTPEGHQLARTVLAARSDAVVGALAVLDESERRSLVELSKKVLVAATTDRAKAEYICRLCDTTACPTEECPVEGAARCL